MEVLVLAHGPFHDPAPRWTVRRMEGELRLMLGSDGDRVAVTLSAAEITTLIQRWKNDEGSPDAS